MKRKRVFGTEKPDPTFGEYTLVNYFDVWGNAKDGWEVNNECVEAYDIQISDDATEKEILQYLVSIEFLKTADRRKVRIDMSGGDEMMEIYQVKGQMPLGRLSRNMKEYWISAYDRHGQFGGSIKAKDDDELFLIFEYRYPYAELADYGEYEEDEEGNA